MGKRTKAAIIAIAVLLAAGTLVSAQSGNRLETSLRNTPKTGEQGAPFNLDESAWCGGPRGGSGGCGGQGGYNGGQGNNGGSGFDCH
ncbi:hypothetical protein FACS1894161_4170 [Spirochaetia bacterium]|nr:hypothetical protein FACS1894161_4170 [Spirochaetia bacterium]